MLNWLQGFMLWVSAYMLMTCVLTCMHTTADYAMLLPCQPSVVCQTELISGSIVKLAACR